MRNSLLSYGLLLAVIVLPFAEAKAQATFTLRTPIEYAHRAGTQLSNGHYVTAGDRGLLCMDTSGTLLWSIDLQSSENYEINRVCEWGNDLICFATIGVNNSSRQAEIFRISPATATIIWQKRYVITSSYTTITTAIKTSDNALLVGGSAGTSNSWFPYVMKLDSTGNMLWSLSMPVSFSSTHMMHETNSGNYLVGIGQATVLMLDPSGNLIWQHAYATTFGNDHFNGVNESASGFLFSGSYYTGTWQLGFVKTDTAGNMLLANSYWMGQQYDHLSTSGAQPSGSGLIITLHNTYFSTPAAPSAWASGTAYVDSSCIIQWNVVYIGNSYSNGIMPLNSGYLFATKSPSQGYADIRKVNTLGNDGCNPYSLWMVPGSLPIDTNLNCTLTPDTVAITVLTSLQASIGNTWLQTLCYVGIEEEQSQFNIQLAPNPATNGTFIITGASTDAVIHVFNAAGQLVYSAQHSVLPATVQLPENCSPGMYFVEVVSDNQRATQKLLVE